MEALFDSQSRLVGWIDLGAGNVWDTNMRWVAFVQNGQVFSATGSGWCGPVTDGTTLCDRSGRPVAWNPQNPPRGTVPPAAPFTPFTPYTPFTPFTPFTPYTPYTPTAPSQGWSPSGFEAWAGRR